MDEHPQDFKKLDDGTLILPVVVFVGAFALAGLRLVWGVVVG